MDMFFRFFISVFLVIAFTGVKAASPIKNDFIITSPKKQKILIATSKGGGAHSTVDRVLTGRLQKQYDVKSVNILTDIWGTFDPLSKITFGFFSGEDLYNYLLRNSWNKALNMLESFGEWRMNWIKDSLVEKLVAYLEPDKPDLIISVVPIIDPYILWACEKLSIPFLVVNLDTNASIYLRGVKAPTYKKFYFTLPFDDALLYEKIAFAQLPKEVIKPIGFPIRDSFFGSRCKGCIKEEFDIPENTPTVMIMMGGQGSELSHTYVKTLAKNTKDRMHLVVCLGRNEKLRKRIEKIKLPKNITISIVGFTDKVADLMSVTDLLITKPGPTTMCEALHMQVPILFSATGEVLRWEQTNIDFVLKHKLGGSIQQMKQAIPLVREWLTDKSLRSAFKKNVIRYNQTSFRASFDVLVRELLASSSVATNVIVQ